MESTDADFKLMTKWLSNPKVYHFVHGVPYNLKKVREKYGPRIAKKDNINACFIEYKGEPIGYIQYYEIAKAKEYELKRKKNIWAIDLWIGEPEFWEQGIGSTTVKFLSNYLLKEVGAAKVIIDPHLDNPRAIRAYEKAGFVRVKILKQHEDYKDTKIDCLLMEKLSVN